MSRSRLLIILGVTIGLMGLVAVWMIVLDKGRVSIAAVPPYSVSVEGGLSKVPRQLSCTTDPCVLRFPTDSYRLVLTKSDYYEETRSITVKRGEVLDVLVDFRFIPTLVEVTEQPEGLMGGESGGDEGRGASALTLEYDSTYRKWRLVGKGAEEEKVTWAYFDRSLNDPQIFGVPDGAYALVMDRVNEDEAVYRVERETASRALLGVVPQVAQVEWSPDTPWVLLQSARSPFELWLLQVKTGEFRKLPLSFLLDKVVWAEGGRLVFATQGDLRALEGRASDSTVEALQVLLTDELRQGAPIFSVGDYDVETRVYRSLYEVLASMGLEYEAVQIKTDPEGTVFVLANDRVFQLVME